MSWRCLGCGPTADAVGQRMLLLFRFLLRIFLERARRIGSCEILETGGRPWSCELIEVAQELHDVVATCGAPVIVTPGFAREDWIIFMSHETGLNAVSRHDCGARLGRLANAQLPSVASMVGACILHCTGVSGKNVTHSLSSCVTIARGAK